MRHGLRLKSHHPFESVAHALRENKDIKSDSQMIETETSRILVRDTDSGRRMMEYIEDLKELLRYYG